MNVLVTGASGFVGRHLVERLAADGAQVRALVRPGTNPAWLEALGAQVRRGDIGDAHSVQRVAEECQVVFHLAAKTEALGPLSRHDVQVANVQGTENVVRAALRAGVQRFVFCSSVSVYGRIVRNRLIDERTETDPDSPYGESKRLGEQLVLAAREREGLPGVVARLSTVWGPGTTSWLGLFRTIAAGHFRVIGDGANHHHIADVVDVIEGLLLCASVKGVEGRTYILAGREAVPLNTLVDIIGAEVGATGVRRICRPPRCTSIGFSTGLPWPGWAANCHEPTAWPFFSATGRSTSPERATNSGIPRGSTCGPPFDAWPTGFETRGICRGEAGAHRMRLGHRDLALACSAGAAGGRSRGRGRPRSPSFAPCGAALSHSASLCRSSSCPR